MSMQSGRRLGQPEQIQVSALRLDPQNPRLPEEMQGQDQEELAVSMALGFDALTVAESIASHGYFMSEPLIAIPSVTEPGAYVVVEGNRRLAALLGLTRDVIRNQFADAEKWSKLAAESSLPTDPEVPVVVVVDRTAVTPIIGFRHISGILQWQPYAQARYVATLVEKDGMSFGDIAHMIGVDRTRVASLYRDQAIAGQAEELGVETGNLERSFTLLTVAMNTSKLRSFIGAPVASQTTPGVAPVPRHKEESLRELLTWIYGDGVKAPVITDSREISKLGNVVATGPGLKSLRDGDSLDHALQKVKDAQDDPRKRLLSRLKAGKNALIAASEDISDFAQDVEVGPLVDEILEAVAALEAAIDESDAAADAG